MTDKLRGAAQMALDALEYAEQNHGGDDCYFDAIEALRAALAQQEQERDRGGACVVVNGTSGVFTVPLPGKPGGGGISPPSPQREWVGLTAKDLAEIPASCFEGAIWADAKLKEKNT